MRPRDPRRLLARRREAMARVRILDHATHDYEGGVSTEQVAEVSLPRGELDRRWTPENLERLARTYWRFLTLVTLGILRIRYTPDSREVAVLGRPLVLLRFNAPEYDLQPTRGSVTWRIRDGLLVLPRGRGRGFLRLSVKRLDEASGGEDSVVRVTSEVASYQPLIAGSGRFSRIGRWIYAQTQLRIHIVVTNAFLRSLARLDLEESVVGALRPGEGLSDPGAADVPQLGAVVPGEDPADRP